MDSPTYTTVTASVSMPLESLQSVSAVTSLPWESAAAAMAAGTAMMGGQRIVAVSPTHPELGYHLMPDPHHIVEGVVGFGLAVTLAGLGIRELLRRHEDLDS